MKKIVIAAVLALSAVSLAGPMGIVAPRGEYIALSCVTVDAAKPFSVRVMKDTRNKNISMVLEAEGQAPKVYPKTKEIVDPRRVGSPMRWEAPASGGIVRLVVNFTTAPNPKGRRGVFTASSMGRTTQAEMLCNRVAY